MFYYERKLKKSGFELIVGCDEAGRGALAGPVVGCALVLRKNKFKNRISDSKILSPKQRLEAYKEISKNAYFGLGIVNERIIERLNIKRATVLAIENAIGDLMRLLKRKNISTKKTYILADGDLKLRIGFPYRSINSLDKKSLTCAAASIVAKVIRDRIMSIYDSIYPDYGFLKHKGYPTSRHILAIKKCGPCFIHRMTFTPHLWTRQTHI
jgi:ribonuclease HII